MKQRALFFILLPFLVAAGCGENDPLNRQAVSGKIMLDGELLAEGTIEFTPVDNGVPSGASFKDGVFTIPKEKGLPPGDYVVRITAASSSGVTAEIPGESNLIPAELIPEKYNTKSHLGFHVDETGSNFLDLDLKSK
jgi:hypothetical protein